MAAFTVGQSIVSTVPRITVDGDLEPGRHRFTLVVTDDAGNSSAVAEAVVLVFDRRPPPPG